MFKTAKFIVIGALLASIFISCSNNTEMSNFPRENKSKLQVVFDLSHKEIFSPESTEEMGYSVFYNMFKEKGFAVETNNSVVDQKLLQNTQILVYAGPMTPFSAEEIQNLKQYLYEGGGLLVLLHISQPAIPLLNSFDMQPTVAVVKERNNLIDNHLENFYIVDLQDKHNLFTKVDKLALFGSWGLRSVGDKAKMIAWTSQDAWADMNKDNQPSNDELVQKFGVIGVSEYGQGRFVVIADDAPLINKFINEEDNRTFGNNLIRWLNQGGHKI